MSRSFLFISLLLVIFDQVRCEEILNEVVSDKSNENRKGHLISVKENETANDGCFNLFLGGGSIVYNNAKVELKGINGKIGTCPQVTDTVEVDGKKVPRLEKASLTLIASIEDQYVPKINITITTVHDLFINQWTVSEVKVGDLSSSELILDLKHNNYLFAPSNHSYSCRDLELRKSPASKGEGFTDKFIKLNLRDFQIQPFRGEIFNESYDCASWFTIGTFLGFLVLLLFSLILSFGISYIMNIKTNDRFEDPKGKPLQLGNTDN